MLRRRITHTLLALIITGVPLVAPGAAQAAYWYCYGSDSTEWVCYEDPAVDPKGAGGVPGCTNQAQPPQAQCRKQTACDPSTQICIEIR